MVARNPSAMRFQWKKFVSEATAPVCQNVPTQPYVLPCMSPANEPFQVGVSDGRTDVPCQG